MTIEEKIIRIIKENSEQNFNITLHTDLQEDMGIDSFGTIMIINGIEDEFDIEIADEDARSIRTVAEITTLLQKRYDIKE